MLTCDRFDQQWSEMTQAERIAEASDESFEEEL